ncbi:MAG: hypothetical protein AAF716_23350 [Cyanobacteria bacterium P01_D01_bin.1]
MIQAIEATGTIDSQGYLQIDQPINIAKDQRVRIIVLLAETEDSISEQDWLKAAATNPSFAFLHDAEEDIYTLDHGQPVSHEG